MENGSKSIGWTPSRHSSVYAQQRVAADSSDKKIRDNLLSMPADYINSHGKTSLILGAYNHMVSAQDFKTLLEKPKTNVNHQENVSGCTALMVAATVGNRPKVDLLLRHPDTDVTLKNHRGFSAAGCAEKFKFIQSGLFIRLVDSEIAALDKQVQQLSAQIPWPKK